MEKSGTEKSPFSQINQVCVIVRDMDKAIEYYSSLGIGPFESLKETVVDRQVYGKPNMDMKNIIRVAQMGPIQFELIQPVYGKCIQKDFLESKGEGLHHLGFIVDDLDKEVAKLVEKGFKVIQSAKFSGGSGTVYLDTDKVGGVVFELIHWASK